MDTALQSFYRYIGLSRLVIQKPSFVECKGRLGNLSVYTVHFIKMILYFHPMNLEEIKLEKIRGDEISLLREISIKTFHDTFAKDNNPEDMRGYLDKSFSIEQLTSELKNPESSFYFAKGKEDRAVMGYLKINVGKAQNELQDRHSLEVERIYVLEAFQGKKVGQLLFNKALETADAIQADLVWLGVWEFNTKAVNFYKKNGFTVFDKHTFVLGTDVQTDILMKKELR